MSEVPPPVNLLHESNPDHWCGSNEKLNLLVGSPLRVETLVVLGERPPTGTAEWEEHLRLWNQVCEAGKLDLFHRQYHEAFSVMKPFGSITMLKAILNAHFVAEGLMAPAEAAELLRDNKALAQDAVAPKEALDRWQKAQEQALRTEQQAKYSSTDEDKVGAVYFSCSFVDKDDPCDLGSTVDCSRSRCYSSQLRTYAGATWSLRRSDRYPIRFLAHSYLGGPENDSLWQHILKKRLELVGHEKHRHVVFVALCARHKSSAHTLPPPPPAKLEFVDAAETLVCAASKSLCFWGGGGNYNRCQLDLERYGLPRDTEESFPLHMPRRGWTSPSQSITSRLALQIVYSAEKAYEDGVAKAPTLLASEWERDYHRQAVLATQILYHAEVTLNGMQSQTIKQLLEYRQELAQATATKSWEIHRARQARPAVQRALDCEQWLKEEVFGKLKC
ncbi:hypothetical protein PYCC9005_004730 [Savitreella phatthalungensis]